MSMEVREQKWKNKAREGLVIQIWNELFELKKKTCEIQSFKYEW